MWFLLFFIFISKSYASPCCGGSSAAPTIISGDDKAQVALSISRSKIIGDAPENGIPVFRSNSYREYNLTYKIDTAYVFSEYMQYGLSIPVIQHSVSKATVSESRTGIGDIKTDFAYETFPELTYSKWKPRGYQFIGLTIPTGNSIFESESRLGTDAVGKGFYTVGTGALFIKKWNDWDAVIIPEIHYSFPRKFKEKEEELNISPGIGLGVTIGAGYSIEKFRVGLRINPNYNQEKNIVSNLNQTTKTSKQLSWDTGLDLTYLIQNTFSFTLAYTDQTILGPAINSTLSRSLSLSFQKRWER